MLANRLCYIQLFQFTLSDQRPKGRMGRLELILGFQSCRSEMDMEAENTITIALQFLITFSWDDEAVPP